MYSALNTLSEYTFSYPKTITLRIFLLVFKITKSLQCISKYLKINPSKRRSHDDVLRALPNCVMYKKVYRLVRHQF